MHKGKWKVGEGLGEVGEGKEYDQNGLYKILKKSTRLKKIEMAVVCVRAGAPERVCVCVSACMGVCSQV